MADVQNSPYSRQTPSRASSRLREKSQRCFSLPSHQEALDSIVPDNETPSKHYSHLKPRKLINNFIKERNTYNNPDGIDLFDEDSDENFIKDSSSSDDESEEEASSSQEGSIQTLGCMDGKSGADRKKLPSGRRCNPRRVSSGQRRSGTDSESDGAEEELAAPLKTHKQRLSLDQSSSSGASSGDNSSPVKKKKRRRHKVSIQSDGSSSEDEAVHSASMSNLLDGEKVTNPAVSENNRNEKQNLQQDELAAGRSDEQSENSGSESSFIATSDSSDCIIEDSLHDTPDSEGSRSNKPSHEELICNYRQKKRRVRQSQSRKKRRIHQLSGGSSSSDVDARVHTPESTSDEETERRLPKRAELLSSKKKAWKSETLGRYQEAREKTLSKKKDPRN